jgi:ankyrin repeat protein
MLNLLVQDKSISDAYSAIKVHNSEWIGLVDGYERNILHLAVEDGNKQLVESLLLAGAPVNSPEGCGVTPLMIAINNNNIDMVQILLWYVNAKDICYHVHRYIFQ